MLHFIHLDDHIIFQKGLKKSLEKKIHNFEIAGFNNNHDAISYLQNCFTTKVKVDIIFTDFNHGAGGNGLDFALKVRVLEEHYSLRTPIMLLTMFWKEKFLLNATAKGVFDLYYPKSVEVESIVNFVKRYTTNPSRQIILFVLDFYYKFSIIATMVNK